MFIHNGVNVSEIRNAASSALKLKGGFNVLFPGGAKFLKGGDLLLVALAELKEEIPDIHTYVALDVPEGHQLRRMVFELELEQNVTFVGFLPPKEYRRLLASVDLLVLPSRREAFPIALLEAMALGKPIVASRVGGIPEVIKDGRNGILVDLEPRQIAQAILRLYWDEKLRQEMARNNLQDIVQYDWSLITEQYIELYRELLQA